MQEGNAAYAIGASGLAGATRITGRADPPARLDTHLHPPAGEHPRAILLPHCKGRVQVKGRGKRRKVVPGAAARAGYRRADEVPYQKRRQ